MDVKMNWMFQSNYDPEEIPDDFEQYWKVSRYRNDMNVDDRVYFWLSGPNGGVYARGRIEERWTRGGDGAPQIKVSISDFFSPLLGRQIFKENKTLAGMQLFQMPMGTNFRLSDEEATEIDRVIENAGGGV